MAKVQTLFMNLMIIMIVSFVSYAIWYFPSAEILGDAFNPNHFIRLWDNIAIFLMMLASVGVISCLLPMANSLNVYLGGVTGQAAFLWQMNLLDGEHIYAFASVFFSSAVMTATFLLITYLVKVVKGEIIEVHLDR